MKIEKIIPFSEDDLVSMQLYLKNHYNFVFTTDSSNPRSLTKGLSVEADFPSNGVIWKCSNETEKYIDCLITTENGKPENNDLSHHIEYIKGQGYAPGLIIAKYLFNCISSNDNKRYDYYHGWVKLDY